MGKCPIYSSASELAVPFLVDNRARTRPDEKPLAFYPHSKRFALQRMAEDPKGWRDHDYARERGKQQQTKGAAGGVVGTSTKLVPDPETKNWRVLLENAGHWQQYHVKLEQEWIRRSAEKRRRIEEEKERVRLERERREAEAAAEAERARLEEQRLVAEAAAEAERVRLQEERYGVPM